MRILLTGMTKMQANHIRRRNYNTSIRALYEALKAAKHTVHWRPLEYKEKGLGENYDVIILGLGTVAEFSCTALYEALWATQYDNVLYLVNDWKANTTIKKLQTEDIFRDFILRNNTSTARVHPEIVMKDRKHLEKLRENMFRRGDNLIGPFFDWGDWSIITDGTPFDDVYAFNPTSFYLKAWGKVKVPIRKKKQWVYGALADYSKWHTRLGATWPIIAHNKKTFIPEDELMKEYAASAGIIFPKYKASGSGWWRARFCHAILAKCYMYCDRSEVEEITSDHQLANDGKLAFPWLEMETVEEQKPKVLAELATVQRKAVLARTPTWQHTVDTIHAIIQEVAR